MKLSGLSDNRRTILSDLRTEPTKPYRPRKCLSTGNLLLLDDGVVLAVRGVLLGVVGPVVGVRVDMNSESLLSSLRSKLSEDVSTNAMVSSTPSEPVEFASPIESTESRTARDLEWSSMYSRNRKFLLVLVRPLEYLCASESV